MYLKYDHLTKALASSLLAKITTDELIHVLSKEAVCVAQSPTDGARVTRKTAEEGVGRDKKRNRQPSN